MSYSAASQAVDEMMAMVVSNEQCDTQFGYKYITFGNNLEQNSQKMKQTFANCSIQCYTVVGGTDKVLRTHVSTEVAMGQATGAAISRVRYRQLATDLPEVSTRVDRRDG